MSFPLDRRRLTESQSVFLPGRLTVVTYTPRGNDCQAIMTIFQPSGIRGSGSSADRSQPANQLPAGGTWSHKIWQSFPRPIIAILHEICIQFLHFPLNALILLGFQSFAPKEKVFRSMLTVSCDTTETSTIKKTCCFSFTLTC